MEETATGGQTRPVHAPTDALEMQIAQWRGYLRRRQATHAINVAELEEQLRAQIARLVEAGLAPDEAFLVAVKRLGDRDDLAREFAREHVGRLWKQFVVVPAAEGEPRPRAWLEAVIAFGLAVAAAIAIKLPALFGFTFEQDETFYARNLSLFVLPFLTGYFVWKRGQKTRHSGRFILALLLAFGAAALFANIYPFAPDGYTAALTALHLPLALWLVVGIAYTGGRWGQVSRRMDFIRFSGELFIYYVLIALGGGVLMGSMAMIFQAIGIDIEPLFETWLLPCGAVGGVLVASWLVEAKQSVIENMAPVLTHLFTPFFAAVLVAFVATVLWTGRGVDMARDALIAFDLLLALVLALLLYSISARDPQAPPGLFDVVQVVLVVSALLANGVALWAIAARITEFGFTPNRVAALGENVILLVNLAWSAVLYFRFLRGRGAFTDLERWQTNYLPVYAVWGALVVILFPPLFAYI